MNLLLRAVVVVLAALLSSTLIAAPAAAHHDHFCVSYTSDTSTQDEYGVEAGQIPLEVIHYGFGIVKDSHEEIAKKGIPVVSQIAAAGEKVIGAIMASITARIGIFKIARFGLSVVNQHADGCRFDEHWLGADHLLAATVRRDLAVTTAPLAQLVLPSSAGGLIDRRGVGVHDVVTRTIQDLKAAGQCTYCGTAEAYVAKAVQSRSEGRYKAAYLDYRRAYVATVR